jgi:hypothetical protein
LVMQHLQFVGRVLCVEQQPIKASAGHHFDSDIARQTAPKSDLLLPLEKFLL